MHLFGKLLVKFFNDQWRCVTYCTDWSFCATLCCCYFQGGWLGSGGRVHFLSSSSWQTQTPTSHINNKTSLYTTTSNFPAFLKSIFFSFKFKLWIVDWIKYSLHLLLLCKLAFQHLILIKAKWAFKVKSVAWINLSEDKFLFYRIIFFFANLTT